jgi:hypothetical protein
VHINTSIKKELLQYYSLLNKNKESFSSFLQNTQPLWASHSNPPDIPSQLATDLDLAKLSHLLSNVAKYNKEHNKITYNEDFLSLLSDEDTLDFTYSLLAMNLFVSKLLIKHQTAVVNCLKKESFFSEYTNPSYLHTSDS